MGGLVTMPHEAQRNGKSEKDRLAEGEQMLADRNAGMRPSAMMEKYSVSKATLYRRLDEAIKARIAPTVDAYREQQNALLDDLMGRWQMHLAAAETMIAEATKTESMALLDRGMTKHAEALAGMLRVAERRARLMGTDAPVRVDAHVTTTTPVDSAVAALVAEVEAAAS